MKVVIINCFETYEHRVDLLYDFFQERGDEVRVLESDFRHIEKQQRTDQKDGYSFIHALPYYKNVSVKRMVSHYVWAREIYKELVKEKPEFIWALIPPNSVAKACGKYKEANQEVRLVYDLIDMWPETMPVKKYENTVPVKMWKQLRDNNLKYADHMVTECNLYQKSLKKIVAVQKMSTIYLARKVTPMKSRPQLEEGVISLCYLGSINNIIDIAKIEEIIHTLKERCSVNLHIIGAGETKQELIMASQRAGANIIDHGVLYESEDKQKIFDCCHYGLNIMKNTVHIGLTMKSMDYLEAGLPILNNIKGDTWELIEAERFGINIDKLGETKVYDMDLRTNARKFFETYMSVDAFRETAQKVLTDVLDKSKR